MTPAEIIQSATTKAQEAARAQFARDGYRDCGTCGGAILILDTRTKIAKAAIAAGIASPDGSVMLRLPEGVSTQHDEVYIQQMSAFRKELEAQGAGKAVRRYWTYID